MLDREKTIQLIQEQMKKQGFNQRSLAVQSGLKPDALRNLFEGKSTMLRADRLAAIFKTLGIGSVQPSSYDEDAMQCAMQAMEETISRTKAHLNVQERVSFLSRLYKLALREAEISGTPAIGAASAEELLQRMKN